VRREVIAHDAFGAQDVDAAETRITGERVASAALATANRLSRFQLSK